MIKFWINISHKLPVIVLIIISASSVVMGDYFAKSWSMSQRTWLFIFAILAYMGSSIFYIPTLLREGLIITSLLWTVISTLGFILIGLVLFKEHLTFGQWIGVAFGITALVILSITRE